MMIRIKIFLPIVTFMAVAMSCNRITSNEPEESIDDGIYQLQAQKIAVEDEIVTSAPVGGYFYQGLEFLGDHQLEIEINSDIASENGTAEAEYEILDSTLHLLIQNTTTSVYEEGEEITFDYFEFVDSTYKESFGGDSASYEFKGPGLILELKYPDKQDINSNGDTTEVVQRTRYYESLNRDGSN